jgi:hypothetical protein
LSLNEALRVCCERGWQGFKADWLTKDRQQQGGNRPASREEARTIAASTRLTDIMNDDGTLKDPAAGREFGIRSNRRNENERTIDAEPARLLG